jgi:hypothetical protein
MVFLAGDTCATPEAKYGITSAQFHAWNPSVSSDCSEGFWAKEAYCVGVSSSGTTTTSSPTSTEIVPPGPTQSGIPANCNEYYIAKCKLITTSVPTYQFSLSFQSRLFRGTQLIISSVAGDTCATPEAKYGITNAQFHAWNPSVSSDCSEGFWAKEAYCVGLS